MNRLDKFKLMMDNHYYKMQEDIISLLHEGEVHFHFFRVTYQSPRYAFGSLNFNKYNIPIPNHKIHHPPGLVVYWDLERYAWRSFYLKNVDQYRLYNPY